MAEVPLTALQLVTRILEKSAVPNRPQTIDHVSAGDPTTTVTGIATMAIASLDCLKRAAAAGKNLILTYDPAFWSGNDSFDRLEANSLFLEKRDFIRANNLVCFNLHDHWRDRLPDGVAAGMAAGLGWASYQNGTNPDAFQLPPTTLLDLARDLEARLNEKTIRVVGDPKLAVHNVAAIWGTAAQMPAIQILNGPIDVLVTGYAREWEAVEYVQDMISSGEKKGLVLLGEAASVDFGMKNCADWIAGFVEQVPVEFIPRHSTYWGVS